MDVKRTVLLGVLGGSVVVWLASAATTTRPVAQPPAPARARVVEVSGAELSAEIARLHDRLRPQAVPTQTRDLFRYSSSRAAAAIATPEPVAVEVPAALNVAPSFKLVGMADDVAILSGVGGPLFVREGDSVATRYRVTKVSPDSIDLLDLNDNTTLHLSLK